MFKKALAYDIKSTALSRSSLHPKMVQFLKLIVCFVVLAHMTYATDQPKKGFFERLSDKIEEKRREKLEKERQKHLEMLEKMQDDVHAIQAGLRSLEFRNRVKSFTDEKKQ